MAYSLSKAMITAVAISATFIPAGGNAFTPSTLFEAEVSAGTSYDASTGHFVYRYRVKNLSSSRQSIAKFAVTYEAGAIRDVKQPEDWISTSTYGAENLVYWEFNGASKTPIPPGGSQAGFSFISANPPAIQSWLASSAFAYAPVSEKEELQISQGLMDHFFKNSKQGTITGPGRRASNDASEMVHRIDNALKEMIVYRWVDDGPLLRALKARLAASKVSLERGNRKTAADQVRAFLLEVDAQRGKQLSPTAADLLKANADYLSSLLS